MSDIFDQFAQWLGDDVMDPQIFTVQLDSRGSLAMPTHPDWNGKVQLLNYGNHGANYTLHYRWVLS